jgi:subtilisin family serine protease
MVSATFVIVPSVAAGFQASPFAPLGKLSAKAFEAMLGGGDVPILVETTSRDYGPLVDRIEAAGGTVGFQYKYITALSAVVPSGELLSIAANSAVQRVYLNEIRQIDSPGESSAIPLSGAGGFDPDTLLKGEPLQVTEDFQTLTLTADQIQDLTPEVYNLALTNALGTVDAQLRSGFGAGTTVAIIDTGIYSGNFMLQGSVVGGIDLSTDVDTPFEGFDRVENHWHGSHVAGIALGRGAILLSPGGFFAQSVETNTGVTLPTFDGGFKILPLLGMAPMASAYVIKVFPHTGAGTSEATIIAAIEHAIDVKDDFGIDVISMSLGGPSLFDGRDLEDRTVDAAVDAGIVVVSAAGNDGPAAMTVASPGSAHKGMAVAAAAMPANVRVLWDLLLGSLSAGDELFVGDDPRIIAFSSRGPSADGRTKPDVAAPGVFVLSAFPSPGNPHGIAFASGTSMATPHVSGAALLATAFAELEGLAATPADIKNALKESAEPLPLYDTRDFGSGLINVDAALDVLATATLGATEESLPVESVPLADIATGQIDVASGMNEYEATVTLSPGENVEIIFETDLATSSIEVEIEDVDLGQDAPNGQQWLQIFEWDQTGQPQVNSLEVYIHGAKRSSSFFDYEIDSANVWGDAEFVVTDDETTAEGDLRLDVPIKPFGVFNARMIEPGFYKIVIENDWTSFDDITLSFSVEIETEEGERPDRMFRGVVLENGLVSRELVLRRGTEEVTFILKWASDWSQYPTYDLDLILLHFSRTGEVDFLDFQAATLNAPEKSFITTPEGFDDLSGRWRLFIIGFSIPVEGMSEFTVEVFIGD